MPRGAASNGTKANAAVADIATNTTSTFSSDFGLACIIELSSTYFISNNRKKLLSGNR